MQKQRLEEKVVVISGATGGLGTTVTAAFLDAGAKVAAVDRMASSKEAAENYVAIAADLETEAGAKNVAWTRD